MNTNRFHLIQRDKKYFEWIVTLDKPTQQFHLGANEENELALKLGMVNRILISHPTTWSNWDIIWNDTKRVIGNCGFHNIAVRHRRAEIGYGLNEAYRRIGIMTEVVPYLIDHGFSVMNLNRIEACVGPENIPSLSIINKYGFTKEGVLRQHYNVNGKLCDSILFSLLAEERLEK